MDAKTKEVFEAAGVDVCDLTHIPAKSIHDFAVSAEAWLDADDVLMFVHQRPADITKFMYYIGEEFNHGGVGIGRGIVGYQLSEFRGDWLRARVVKVPS